MLNIMIEFKIIEDCSPYYIRFTHEGIDEIIKECLSIVKNNVYSKGFTHHALEENLAEKLLDKIPISKLLSINKSRVSFFITNPGYYYRAHKDGLDHRFSINYTIEILDDKCVTSWYSDSDLEKYPIDNLKHIEYYKDKNKFVYDNGCSREADGFIKENHIPLKSMTAKSNEVILFNTDIFHDFDNSKSKNQRIVLTLRATKPANIYFNDVKQILFPTI